MKSCSAEKRSFTVTLAVAADGKKLPPKVIFKGVRTPRDLAVPESVWVSFHKKGWMDETWVKEWIETCVPRIPTDERSLLDWDSYRVHLTESVKEALQRRKINVAVIPGGLTLVLQPLDKCLNKPFKDHVKTKYLSWVVAGPFEFTPAGKKKGPLRNQVLRLIKQSWNEIPEEMVSLSVKTFGISNALDGTEDDAVYEEEMPEIYGEEEEEEMEEEFDTDSDEDEP